MRQRLMIAVLVSHLAAGGVVAADDTGARSVLSMIPAKVPTAIVVTDLPKLESSIKELAGRLGLPANGAQLTEFVRADLGIGAWIDVDRPIGLVTLGRSQPPIVWAAVPGFANRIQSRPDAVFDDKVWCLPTDEAQSWFVLPVAPEGHDYVIIAATRAAIELAVADGPTLGETMGPRAQLFQRRDVIVHYNMEAQRAHAVAGVDQFARLVPLLAASVTSQTGGDPQRLNGMLAKLFDGARALVEQLSYVDMYLSLDKKAARLTLAVGFTDGGIKRFLAAQLPATASPMPGISFGPYLVAASWHLPGGVAPLCNPLIDKTETALIKARADAQGAASAEDSASPQADAIRAAADRVRALARAVEQGDAVVSVTKAAIQVKGEMRGTDPAALHHEIVSMLTEGNPVLSRLKGGLSSDATGTREVEGAQISLFRLKLDAWQSVLGQTQDSVPYAIGRVDDCVRYCLGCEDEMASLFSASVPEPFAAAGPVKDALAVLPARRNAVVLIDLGGWFGVLNHFGEGSDRGILPPGPPIAISLSLSDKPARLDVHVPIRAVERFLQALNPPAPM